jgi:hypothetical protein
VDENNLLSVTAKELATGITQKVEVKPSYPTDKEVERTLLDALDHGKSRLRGASPGGCQVEGRSCWPRRKVWQPMRLSWKATSEGAARTPPVTCTWKKGAELLSESEEDEEDILDKAFDVRMNSRLGCQAKLQKDGVVELEISKESLDAFYNEHPDVPRP